MYKSNFYSKTRNFIKKNNNIQLIVNLLKSLNFKTTTNKTKRTQKKQSKILFHRMKIVFENVVLKKIIFIVKIYCIFLFQNMLGF